MTEKILNEEELKKVAGGNDSYVRGDQPIFKENDVFRFNFFKSLIVMTVLEVHSDEEQFYYLVKTESFKDGVMDLSNTEYVSEEALLYTYQYRIVE